MDIDKLIERLKGKHFKRDFDCTPFECGVFGLLDNAADVLSTLQAENEKLRAEVEQVKQAAENDIPHNCHTCKHCSDPMCPGNTTKNSFGFQENCNSWQWRGQRKRDYMELFKEKTIREHLEDMLCDKECSAEMTGYQHQAVDALIELLGYCDYDRLCELARVDKNGFCTGCTFEPGDRDDYPCTVCRRNPALTDKYEVNSNG